MADGDPILIGQHNSGTSITFVQQTPVYLRQGSQLVVVSSPQGGYGIIAESDNADGVSSGSVNAVGVTAFSQNDPECMGIPLTQTPLVLSATAPVGVVTSTA